MISKTWRDIVIIAGDFNVRDDELPKMLETGEITSRGLKWFDISRIVQMREKCFSWDMEENRYY